jgi:hypothetical protein
MDGLCREVFANNEGLVSKEVVLKTGLPPGQGHSLFFAPDKAWMDVVMAWIAGD